MQRFGKLKVSTVLGFFIFLIFILEYRCFYLFEYPTWLDFLRDNELNMTTSILGVLLTVLCYYSSAKYDRKLYNRIVLYAVVCALIWLLYCMYSALLYPRQPISVTVGFHCTFLYMFWIIPFLAKMYLDGGIHRIFSLANVVIFLWYLVLIYQHIEYFTSMRIVFNLQELIDSTTRGLTRSFGIRLSIKSLGSLMILYNFDQVLNKKGSRAHRLFCTIILVLGLYCLIAVQQTRALNFAVICSMVLIAVMGAEKLDKKIIILCGILITLAVALSSGLIQQFLFSFTLNSQNSERFGTSLRIEAMSYYLQCFVRTFGIGNGFTSDLYYPQIQHGPSGEAFYSDVGIFGLLGEVGIASAVFFLYPLWRLVKISWYAIKKRQRRKYALLIGMTFFVIATTPTLIITATSLALGLPLIMAYAEYAYAEMWGQNTRGRIQVVK